MKTIEAAAMGMASRNNRVRVFDWDKAAQLIIERKPEYAAAGLSGDWEWTGGGIWRDGAPIPAEDTYTHLASTWAMPELEIDGETIDCWRYEDETPGWDSETYWPDSARAIVNADA